MTAWSTLNGRPSHAGGMAEQPDPEVPARPRRRRFSVEYKQAILAEYERCSEDGAKGALLRREGLYSSHITQWRQARDAGGRAALDRPRGRPPADPGRREADRQRARAERAEAELAKARLVIEVQGKVSALLEQISESAEPPPGSTR